MNAKKVPTNPSSYFHRWGIPELNQYHSSSMRSLSSSTVTPLCPQVPPRLPPDLAVAVPPCPPLAHPTTPRWEEAALLAEKWEEEESWSPILTSMVGTRPGRSGKWKHAAAVVARGHLRVARRSCCAPRSDASVALDSPVDPGRPFDPQNSGVEAEPWKIQRLIQGTAADRFSAGIW
jgi:hypothetical protein